MEDMKKIHDFAVKWCDKFRDKNIDYIDLVDHFMADDCAALGFEMDCGQAFSEKYGQAVNNHEALDKIIDEVTDVSLLGSAIYSRWRYFNHWAYSGAEILEPGNRAWFISAFSRMVALSGEPLVESEGDKKMKIIELKCSGCGAQITPDLVSGTGVCEYCGLQIVFENKDVLKKILAGVRQKPFGENREHSELPKAPEPKYFPWCDSGLKDHAMDWKDDALEAAMREVTGIKNRDIMLSDVYKLTSLQLNEKGIEKVDALNELINLQRLVLENNSISSIAGLTKLKNLTFLNLYKNNVADIGGIAYMPLLNNVCLAYNMVTDLMPLAELKYIETLYVFMNRVTNVSPLKNLISLKDLRIDFNPIRDISALSGLKCLESLNIMQTDIEDLSPLLKLENLKNLVQ